MWFGYAGLKNGEMLSRLEGIGVVIGHGAPQRRNWEGPAVHGGGWPEYDSWIRLSAASESPASYVRGRGESSGFG
jgi:hypothetical protein